MRSKKHTTYAYTALNLAEILRGIMAKDGMPTNVREDLVKDGDVLRYRIDFYTLEETEEE